MTYQIEPEYVGPGRIDTSSQITIVYEVRGGDQVQINRFTIQGETASFPQEEFIQTDSANSELTAVPVQVLPR